MAEPVCSPLIFQALIQNSFRSSLCPEGEQMLPSSLASVLGTELNQKENMSIPYIVIND